MHYKKPYNLLIILEIIITTIIKHYNAFAFVVITFKIMIIYNTMNTILNLLLQL